MESICQNVCVLSCTCQTQLSISFGVGVDINLRQHHFMLYLDFVLEHRPSRLLEFDLLHRRHRLNLRRLGGASCRRLCRRGNRWSVGQFVAHTHQQLSVKGLVCLKEPDAYLHLIETQQIE